MIDCRVTGLIERQQTQGRSIPLLTIGVPQQPAKHGQIPRADSFCALYIHRRGFGKAEPSQCERALEITLCRWTNRAARPIRRIIIERFVGSVVIHAAIIKLFS